MDSATSAECAEITRAAGGDNRMVLSPDRGPSNVSLGPQIRKFFKDSPEEWAHTCEIHLVSSFMARCSRPPVRR